MNKQKFKRTHFEIHSQLSQYIVKNIFGVDGCFYNVIDELYTELNNSNSKTKNVFPYDLPCNLYLDYIHKKIYNKSIFDEPIDYIRSAFWETYITYLFYKNHKKVFRLSDNLTHLLVDTEIKKVDSFFLELPYPCVYLAIPEHVNLLNPFGIKIDGVYIALFSGEDINFEGLSQKYQEYKNLPHAKSFIVVALSNTFLAESDPRESLYYWHIILKEGDLFTQMEEYLNEWVEEVSFTKNEANKNFIRNMFSFIINTILYINTSKHSLNEEPASRANINNLKSKKKIKKALQKTALPFYFLGKEIVIDHNYHKAIDISQNNIKYHNRLTSQWLVRGHWRQQACGTKLTERKLTWIQPYVKGKEFGEFLDKGYKVK